MQRLSDVLGAEDVRLDRLERVVLADRHLLERGRVDDDVDALDGAAKPVAVADVADEEPEPRVVELCAPSRVCLSSSRLKIRMAAGFHFASAVRVKCWPNEPVPPVTRMVLPSNSFTTDPL